MNEETILSLQMQLDKIIQVMPEVNVEFWFARDLMIPLGYLRWENFVSVIKKAIIACETTGGNPDDHFRDVTKMVETGSGAARAIEDFMLTRYACYLIAQNGDPRKEPIAFAQSYFALQTRKQELLEESIKLRERIDARLKLRESEKTLSKNIYERGVDDEGFGRIRSKGDAALFGGKTTLDMKVLYGITQSRPLADFLPTLTIAAKNLATEMTNLNVERDDLKGEKAITTEHVQNNQSVRDMLNQRGIKPEELPPEEDLLKLERRVKSAVKKIGKQSGKLPKN
ncbi:MAG: DNA damage-inducible protein D [Candidatus Cloacimonetes bacterium HGW-Cloacimonetes-3]|jgi:DNA-damage-inducible protein D|nr:MAG: DNA damage-inducible protein D [Candidatus Cloacimonetes bacterium HGW-Cloacimonetes-3]